MNILYVCHRIPYPLNKGEKIRAYHQIRRLSEKNQVYLFCLADKKEDLKEADHLRTFCKAVEVEYSNPILGKIKSLHKLFTRSPMTLSYFFSRKLYNKVLEASKKIDFDVAVAYSSGVIPYVEKLSVPIALDMVDLDSQKWLQYAQEARFPMNWIYSHEGRALFEYEIKTSKEADATILVSQEEGEILKREGDPKHLEIVTLGTDTEYYKEEISPDPEIAAMDRPTLIFVGAMDYKPNVEAVRRFALQILPLAAKEVKDPLFLVVGGNPAPAVRALGQDKNVWVTGKVKDTRPYLRAADLAVVPLNIARGMQSKVLEAMAVGLPIVLTKAAATGIHAKGGIEFLVADSDRAIKDAVVDLLTHKEKARTMGQAGLSFVTQNFAWSAKLDQYEELINKIALKSF